MSPWTASQPFSYSHERQDSVEVVDRCLAELPRLRQLKDESRLGWTLIELGRAHARLAQWDSAAACLEEAALAAGPNGVLQGAISLAHGEVALGRHDLLAAQQLLERSVAILQEQDEGGTPLAEALKLLGTLHRRLNQPRLAAERLEQALTVARRARSTAVEAEVLCESALLQLEEGRNSEALLGLNCAQLLLGAAQRSPEARAIESRVRAIKDIYLRTAKAWGDAIESKDHYTAGHCDRVADYTSRLAMAVGFRGEALDWLRIGAFLHDVGKTAVPDAILNKPGPLTASEWVIMKTHTEVGDGMIAQLNFPFDLRVLIRNHHERWDGNGYPDRLCGEAIPLVARILCIADVYDALTSTRSYKKALGHQEAIQIMSGAAGQKFDPRLLNLFRTVLMEPAA